MRTRYQRGWITTRKGVVYGHWRKEPDQGKRQRGSVRLGKEKRGRTKNAWLDDLKPHVEAYYRSLTQPAVTPGMTLREFVETVYLPAHEQTWAVNTREAITAALKKHVLRPLGDRPLASIIKADIVTRLNEMRARGYAKRTLIFTRWMFHAIFEEALDNDLITRTPVRRITLANIPDARETKPLTESEARLIIDRTSGMVRLAWRLLIGCGLRPGELCALRRNDVDGGVLRVDEAYERGQYKSTKTGKVRFVPLAGTLQAELTDWLLQRPAKPTTPIFSRASGEPLTVADLRDVVQMPTRTATGLSDLTLRQARATFGTLLQGDVADTQAMLGHADARTTLKHYKRAITERQAAAVEELDARLTRQEAGKVVTIKRRVG